MESEYSINLSKLKITTYIYDKISGYDESYCKVRELSGDFSQTPQMNSVFQFLREWGCRQLTKAFDNDRNISFRSWFNQHGPNLPDDNILLLDLEDADIRGLAHSIQALMDCHASLRKGRKVRFGPVGASKALLVMRKNVFAPWDNPIIDRLNEIIVGNTFSKDGKGYCEYLIYVKNQLKVLENEVGKTKIINLPTLVNRPKSSLPKLIDEHLWVSITGKIDPQVIITMIR